MNTSEQLTAYYDRKKEQYQIECILALLNWDQRVFMPIQAAEARAGQIEYLGLLLHRKTTDPDYMRLIDNLAEQLDSLPEDDRVNIRESKRVLDIERKLPEDFVAQVHQASALAYSAWAEARPADDFKAVQPHLEKIVDLSRRMCDLIGYDDNPYDVLLDQYEPGAKTAWVKPLLTQLATELTRIIPPITERFKNVPELQGAFLPEIQQFMSNRVVEDLGFSFDSGRIDTTMHPFMTTLGPRDFRITTHFDESDYAPALYGTIHETGHALYELGLPLKYAGTPMGSAISLGIHESQSRLWENLIGRSLEFCRYLTGVIHQFFPVETGDMDAEALWNHANRVKPTLIRIEADEVTYSQHIVVRMLLEESLVKGELKVADLPNAWNDLYEQYLGVRPSNYKDGVMQDVHWYNGSIGYFPTYALGNLYGAMMMDTAKQQIPSLSQQIEQGNFSSLLTWLRQNVHQHGMRYKGTELIQKITGQELNINPFIQYLQSKFQLTTLVTE